MKTLILILFTTIASAQYKGHIYLSTIVDFRNVIFGSNPTNNNSALDLTFRFGAHYKVLDVCLIYETFPKIGFDRYGVGIGHPIKILDKREFFYKTGINLKDIVVTPTLEISAILRNWSVQYGVGSINGGQSSHWTLGFSTPIRIELTNRWELESQTNVIYRTDLAAKYGNHKWILNQAFGIVYNLR